MSDFNVCAEEISMSGCCDTFGLKSLIKDATCYKNPENPSSIDLNLTNNTRSFQNSCVIETGLPVFHRMVVTVMKTSFERLKPRVINYRDYKSLEEFIEICQKALNQKSKRNYTKEKQKKLYKTTKLLCLTTKKIKERILQ